MAITQEGLQDYIDNFVQYWFDGYEILTGQHEDDNIPVSYGNVYQGRFCYVRDIDEICTYSGYSGRVSFVFDLNISKGVKYPTSNWIYTSCEYPNSWNGIIPKIANEYCKYAGENFRFRPNSFMDSSAGTSSSGNLRRFGLYNASNNLVVSVWNTNGLRIDSSTLSPMYTSYTGQDFGYSTSNAVYLDSNGVPCRVSDNSTFPYSDNLALCFPLKSYPVFTTNNTYFDSYISLTNQSTYTVNITNNDNSVSTVYYTDNGDIYYPMNNTPFDFDDLLNLLNTITGLIGVNNNFITPVIVPDFDTIVDMNYPSVTGDININIDLPDVTGVYPAETITPIDSDIYNIMSIDSMPQLPSLTGIDNGESAAALGSSFTFLDGCGLLMPFVTIAIIRLLISKFRGDS